MLDIPTRCFLEELLSLVGCLYWGRGIEKWHLVFAVNAPKFMVFRGHKRIASSRHGREET